MAARMKEAGYQKTESVAEAIIQEATKKVKKIVQVDDKSINSDAVWTQDQQKLLETAIVKYPKSGAGDRWQKIANTVPGKTKEECLARYKYLVQKVKEQKLKAVTVEQENKVEPERVETIEEIKPIENAENIKKTSNIESVADDDEPEKPTERKSGGKPRNKRKERKKRMEFSSDEEEYNYDD